MGFSKYEGYTPIPISDMMLDVMNRVNEQFGTSFTIENFEGSNWYKYMYALMQRLQENEVKTSEIVVKLQNYFSITNEMLARPNTTGQGLIDYFAARGFNVSVKPVIEAEAGELRVAVDLNNAAPDYAEKRDLFASLLKNCVIQGIHTVGDVTVNITFSNLQSFPYRFNLATKIPIKLRLTLTLSDNNNFTVLTPEATAQLLFDNVNARYRFGLNFEPERYFSVLDAPWASSVLLEYSIDDGANWLDDVAALEYDELYTFDIDDISVVES